MRKTSLYLDYHAATPLCTAAQEAMARAEQVSWANPASVHAAGRASRRELELARRLVAASVNASASDIIFTSGGTEACNALVFSNTTGRVHCTELDHPAVLEAVRHVGGEIARSAEEIAPATGDTIVTQWVNHETGGIAELPRLAKEWQERGARVLVDATQAYGRLAIDWQALPFDAMALASHKVGGPSGAGAIVMRRCATWQPRALGGGQERGLRGGTPDVRALAGFGGAASVIEARLAQMAKVAEWRDSLESVCVANGAVVNGRGERVASVSNVSFSSWKSSELVAALDLEGLCVSAGAACSSGVATRSSVVFSLYAESPWRSESTLRLSLGPEGLQTSDIDSARHTLADVLQRGRGSANAARVE